MTQTTTNFSTWSHANLAKLAEELTLDNIELREKLRVALDAYRNEVITNQVRHDIPLPETANAY